MFGQNLLVPDSTDSYASYLNKLLSPVISAKDTLMSATFLYDKVIPLARLTDFNDSVNISGPMHFARAYNELYASSLEPVQSIRPDTLGMMVYSYEQRDTVLVGIINVDFHYIDSSALKPQNPLLAINPEGRLQPVAGKNPLHSKHSLVISPLVFDTLRRSQITLFFGPIVMEDAARHIKDLVLIAPGEHPVRIVKNGRLQQWYYGQSFSGKGVRRYRFDVTYDDGSTQTTYADLPYHIPDQSRSASGNTSRMRTFRSEEAFRGYDELNASKGLGQYKIYYAHGRNRLQKPFIYVDGYDPWDINYNFSFSDIYNESFKNLFDNLRTNGYDVVILNFPVYPLVRNISILNNFQTSIPVNYYSYRDGGVDFIERNGKVLKTLIRRINDSLTANGSNEPVVLMGYSMGGLVARYALNDMEIHHENHNVSFYISYDSPHLGAHVPASIQYLGQYVAGTIPSSEFPFGVIQKILYETNFNPAAQQMLIDRVYLRASDRNRYGNFHHRFMQTIRRFPQNVKSMAVVNGSMTGQLNPSPHSDRLIYSFNPVIPGVLNLLITGYETPESGSGLVFQVKRLYMYGLVSVTLFRKNHAADPQRGSLDVAPGSFFNYQQYNFRIGNYYIMRFHNNPDFIPTKSALSYQGRNPRWSEPLACRNLVCTGETPFDTYAQYDSFMSENIFHSDIDNRYVRNKIINNLHALNTTGNVLPPNVKPPTCYTALFSIEGDRTLCCGDEKTYRLSDSTLTGTCVQNGRWEVSPGLAVVSSSAGSVRVRCTNPDRGIGYVDYVLGNVQERIRRYVAGKPAFEIRFTRQGNTGVMYLHNDTLPPEDQSDNIMEITWTQTGDNGILYNSGIPGDDDVAVQYDVSNGYIEGYVSVTNDCGTTTAGFFIDGAQCLDCRRDTADHLLLVRIDANKYEVIYPCKPKGSYTVTKAEFYDQYGVKLYETVPPDEKVEKDPTAQTGDIRIIRVKADGKAGVKRVLTE